jgi:hypothetical protein
LICWQVCVAYLLLARSWPAPQPIKTLVWLPHRRQQHSWHSVCMAKTSFAAVQAAADTSASTAPHHKLSAQPQPCFVRRWCAAYRVHPSRCADLLTALYAGCGQCLVFMSACMRQSFSPSRGKRLSSVLHSTSVPHFLRVMTHARPLSLLKPFRQLPSDRSSQGQLLTFVAAVLRTMQLPWRARVPSDPVSSDWHVGDTCVSAVTVQATSRQLQSRICACVCMCACFCVGNAFRIVEAGGLVVCMFCAVQQLSCRVSWTADCFMSLCVGRAIRWCGCVVCCCCLVPKNRRCCMVVGWL